MLPDEFIPEQHGDFSNFSFDAKERQPVSKIEFVKNKILEYIENAQEILIKYNFEDKLQKIIDILQEQEVMKTKKDSAQKPIPNKHAFLEKEKLNVFKDTLSNSFQNSFNGSIVKPLSSQKFEETNSSVIQVINQIQSGEENHPFQETSSFSLEPRAHVPVKYSEDKKCTEDEKQNLTKKAEVKFVKAKFNFKKEKPKDLMMKKGEIVEVISTNQNGWWVGKNLTSGEQGYFPFNFVELIE